MWNEALNDARTQCDAMLFTVDVGQAESIAFFREVVQMVSGRAVTRSADTHVLEVQGGAFLLTLTFIVHVHPHAVPNCHTSCEDACQESASRCNCMLCPPMSHGLRVF